MSEAPLRNGDLHPVPGLSRGWRWIILLILVIASAALLLCVVLFARNSESLKSNREAINGIHDITCGFGRALTNAPIIQLPDQTTKQFNDQLHRTERLIRDLRLSNCPGIGFLHVVRVGPGQAKIVKGGGRQQTGQNPSQQPGPSEGAGQPGVGPQGPQGPQGEPAPESPPILTDPGLGICIRPLICKSA